MRTVRGLSSDYREQRRGEISVRRANFGSRRWLRETACRLLESAESRARLSPVDAKPLRIGGGPGFRELECFLPVLDGIAVVAPRNKEPLALADPVPQLECSSRIRRSQRRLTGVGVHAGQECVSHCEGWIEVDRPLKLRNGFEKGLRA